MYNNGQSNEIQNTNTPEYDVIDKDLQKLAELKEYEKQKLIDKINCMQSGIGYYDPDVWNNNYTETYDDMFRDMYGEDEYKIMCEERSRKMEAIDNNEYNKYFKEHYVNNYREEEYNEHTYDTCDEDEYEDEEEDEEEIDELDSIS